MSKRFLEPGGDVRRHHDVFRVAPQKFFRAAEFTRGVSLTGRDLPLVR